MSSPSFFHRAPPADPASHDVIIKGPCSSSSHPRVPALASSSLLLQLLCRRGSTVPPFNEAFISQLKTASLSHFVIVNKAGDQRA